MYKIILYNLFGLIILCAEPSIEINLKKDAIPTELKKRSSFSHILRTVMPSVITIQTEKKMRLMGPTGIRGPKKKGPHMPGTGSGVILSKDGYIVTNYHVIKDSDWIRVFLKDKKSYLVEIIGTDPQTDLALLKLKGRTDLSNIEVGDSSQVEIGDMVFAVGNPFGVGQTATKGMVSALGRGLGLADFENLIQTDAAINPGNSGGALIDVQGRLVGINTAIVSRSGSSAGLGFSIPVNHVLQIVDDLLKYGKVNRGFLDLDCEDITSKYLKISKFIKDTNGIILKYVATGSEAEKSGLKKGDFVLAYNGLLIESRRHFKWLVGKSRPGTFAELKVLREKNQSSEEFVVKIKLVRDPKTILKGRKENTAIPRILTGVKLQDLAPSTRRELKVPADTKGAMVYKIDGDCAAYRGGLRQNDVIIEVSKKKVENVNKIIEMINSHNGKSLLLTVLRNGLNRFIIVKK